MALFEYPFTIDNLRFSDAIKLTIASGAIRVDGGRTYRVDTEAGAASDNLDTIYGGESGELICVRAENATHTVVIRDGAGNIECAGANITLDDTDQFAMLLYDTTLAKWVVIGDAGAGLSSPVSVADGGTGLTSGTSGGIPYYSAAGTMASSAALTANAVMIGGGVGATPSTISASTTTAHALFATAGAPAFRALANGDMPTGVALLAGRAGGQTLEGDTASGGNLILSSTHHGTKAKIIFGSLSAYDEVNNRIGIGTITPAQRLDILSGAIRFSYMTAPGACTAAELDEVGLVTAGNHYVKITFVNAIGQSDVGTASGVVAAAGSKEIRCTSIPVGTDPTVTDRKVWMTAAGGTTYYYVGAVGDNTTTQYDINVADATLITQGAANGLGGTSSGGFYAGTTRIGGIDSLGYLNLWQDKNGDQLLQIRNDNAGTSARTGFVLRNGSGSGNVAIFNLCGTGYTGDILWQNQLVIQGGSSVSNGIRVYTGAGGFTVSTTSITALNFHVAQTGGNIGIGTATFGTSAAGVLGMAVGTAPTTSPASAFQMWAADVGGVADKAGPHWRGEEGGIAALRSALGTLNIYTYQKDDLADDGTVSLPDATSGICIVSCNAEAGIFLIKADGSVALISTTTGNVAVADTDTDLCCYDGGGTTAIVKNRLGAVGEIRIIYFYN